MTPHTWVSSDYDFGFVASKMTSILPAPRCAIIPVAAMSIKVTYKDGIFEPIEDVKGVRPGQNCTVFSDEELREIREMIGWLNAAEKSFEFWNNPADAVYDTL